jgi:hypothetical protein
LKHFNNNRITSFFKRNKFIIKPTDKNLGPSILNLSNYNNMVEQYLINPKYYRQCNTINIIKLQITINTFLQYQINCLEISLEKVLTKHLFQHSGLIDPIMPKFYAIIKIHKEPLTICPIMQMGNH